MTLGNWSRRRAIIEPKILPSIGYSLSHILSFFQGFSMQPRHAIYPFFQADTISLVSLSSFALLHTLIGREVMRSQKSEKSKKLSIMVFVVSTIISIVAFFAGISLGIVLTKIKYHKITMMGLEPMYGVHRQKKE